MQLSDCKKKNLAYELWETHKSNCEYKFSNEYWVLSVAMSLLKKIQYVILLKSTFVKHYCVDLYTYLLKQPFLSKCMSRF